MVSPIQKIVICIVLPFACVLGLNKQVSSLRQPLSKTQGARHTFLTLLQRLYLVVKLILCPWSSTQKKNVALE